MSMRAWVLAVSITAVSGTVLAEEAKLGRLFFTPAERAALDTQRKLAGEMANRPVRKDADTPKAPPPKMVTLNGVLRRSDGETTIWVNGLAVHERFRDVDVMPGSISREAVAVQLPGSGRRVKLKVGQSVDSATGQVEENYRRAPEPEDPEPSADTDATPPAPVKESTSRRRSRERDDYMPPPQPPAAPPVKTGSDTNASMPEYR